jgi:DNA-binding beta-propeller fold protein YncE
LTGSRIPDSRWSIALFGAFIVLIARAGAPPVEQMRASAIYTEPLPTGARLDPAGDLIDLGSMPLSIVRTPDPDKVIVVLGGWREQGIQVVDVNSMRVTQTLTQDAAFYGAAFSPDGRSLYVSGGNEDAIFCYGWKDGGATFERRIVLGNKKADKTGSRYPAGLGVAKDGAFLYVAENVSDTLAVVDIARSRVVQRLPTDHYPYAVEATADGAVHVSAWGDDTILTFHRRRDGRLSYVGRLHVGRHPSALTANATGSRFFVALSGSDRVIEIDSQAQTIVRELNDVAPGAPAQGSTPNALALSSDQSTLFVAEGGNNAVALFNVATGRLMGRIPTDWYPTAVLPLPGQLLVVSGKGHGSHANPDGPVPARGIERPLGYALGQLNGSLRKWTVDFHAPILADYSKRVAAANDWDHARSSSRYPPFKHIVYIIKENRTYDQVFGDMREGDGDPALVFFDDRVSPNHHALARRFGLFDRFFTNAEVSSQGHIWSTAAYVTDYGERLVPSMYSDRRGTVDGEEIDEPEGGFLWTLAKKRSVTFRDYGEMVTGPRGWPTTQRDLGTDVCPTYPPFNMEIPDQRRADAWIAELDQFGRRGAMPQLEILHLPADHTAGGAPGLCTPRACMADNDLALGRIVEALSKSPFWADTLVLVLEDDSQAGPDHVDSHRGPLLAISAYNRPGVVHRFVNTTDVVAAIEDILGLGRLSTFDYFSRPLADVFGAAPDLTPYRAIVPDVDLDEKNPSKTAAAAMSATLNLKMADRVNDEQFNRILWLMLKSGAPFPQSRHAAPLHSFQLSQ